MSFLAPAAFALLGLVPLIIVMYLLKLRRIEQVVSSVYLWRRMVRDVEANAPWQRLRRNLLLILQLLFLIVLILSLARPFTWAEGASGQAAILLFDISASMAATDLSPSRLEAAKSQAHQFVDGLPEETRVTVIAAGGGARVLLSSSQDRRQAHLAVDGLKVGLGASDLSAALELASAVAARQPDTEIVVFSDGRVTVSDHIAPKGQVRYAPMGLSGDNQAISVLSLRRAPDGQSLSAFVQVTNYSSASVQRRLTLYADDRLINAYDLDVASHAQQAVVVDDISLQAEVVEARLAGGDVLALDDRAWAVYRRGEPAAVTLVTEGNLFLETGLALLPNIEVTVVQPSDWEKQGEEGNAVGGGRSADLTVLDAYVPVTATLPGGSLLFIAPPRSTAWFTVTGRVDQPAARPVDRDDPLLSHVSLAEVSVLETVRLTPRAWARTVVLGETDKDTVPLLLVGERDGGRMAVLAFDLRRSDLPLQIAFPLLLANLTGWLVPGTGGDIPSQVSPGTAVSLALPPDVEAVTMARPDGSTARLAVAQGQAVMADTGQLGVYRLSWEDNQVQFAVNLFSSQESDVRPAEALPVSGAAGSQEAETQQQARHEWWRPLAYVALALLVGEWLYYQRGALARVGGWLRSTVGREERRT
jgi:Ca-activated chloride channel family protein